MDISQRRALLIVIEGIEHQLKSVKALIMAAQAPEFRPAPNLEKREPDGYIVTVAVKRDVSTVLAGTYKVAMNGTNTQLPDITFASGDAPTAIDLVLEWDLKPGEEPVELVA